MILITSLKKTSILQGAPINPHCLPTDGSPHENESLMIAQLNFLTHEILWLKIRTTRIKKYLSRNPQHAETGQSIRTAN